MSNSNVNVAVIGAGVTASLIGFLSRHMTMNLDFWESNVEVGGRMKTMKSDQSTSYVDIGAQYISTAAQVPKTGEIYSSLLKSCTLEILTGDIINQKQSSDNLINYVAPRGMDSVVRHFINLSNFRNVYLSRPVVELNIGDKFAEIIDSKMQTETYDIVILTLPIPVILNLRGNFRRAISEEVHDNLKKVKYSCRDCLVLFFDDTVNVSWAAKYLPHDSVFRYVAIQENKVSVSHHTSSVVFHTSIQFGEEYKTVNDQITKSALVEHARRLFPEFPDPVEIRHFKWNYSQVLNPYIGSTNCLRISEKPMVIIAGDAFTRSNFDGCIVSAESVVNTLEKFFSNSL